MYLSMSAGNNKTFVQAWTGREGFRRLTLSDFETIGIGGKVVSPTHRSHLVRQKYFLILISVRGSVDPTDNAGGRIME